VKDKRQLGHKYVQIMFVDDMTLKIHILKAAEGRGGIENP
jgi:hypothetical protein